MPDPFVDSDDVFANLSNLSSEDILSKDVERNEHELTRSVLGLSLMDTRNIRSRVMGQLSEQVEGVSGRWTLFTNLLNKETGSEQVRTPSTIFAIDSALENKLGIGRTFAPKQRIGEREMIVSKNLAEHLKVLVGESLTLQYDIRLILNMAQRLSGTILPTFLTKEVTDDEL